MKIDPFAPQLLIDYDYFCRILGPLAFGDFIALWHAADVLMQIATEEGFEPQDVSDLVFPDAKSIDTVH